MSFEKIPFRISAGLKDIIGKELITDDDIAIFELVKNSYDAYANNVKIIFKNLSKSPGSDSKIIIADDGHGMSREDMEKKWLFVGYSEKKPEKKKQTSYRDNIKQKRVFAGAKGIGRFSADRLGRYLTLYSKKKNEKQFNKIDIDWKEFEDVQDSDFQTIMTRYTTIPKIPKDIFDMTDKNTILEISTLRDKWDVNKILKLKRYLQRLINPSTDQKNQNFTIEIISDEMKDLDKNKRDYEKVNGPITNFVFEKLDIKTTHMSCELIDSKIKTSLYDKGKLVVSFDEDNRYKLLTHVTVRLFYLNPEAKRAFSNLMGVQPVRYGSVFLYRNGFRVYSYGDEGNDWLGLEKRKGQGYARFLSARELMGRIEILGSSDEFKELSSRSEGLVKTPAYHQLIDFFIDVVLKRFEKYVVEGLGWDTGKYDQEETEKQSSEVILNIIGKKKLKNVHFGEDLLKILDEKRIQQIPEIIKNFEYVKKYIKSKDERDYVDKQLKKVKNYTRTLTKERNEFKQQYEVKKYEALFLDKALSSDKDQLIKLVHSINISSLAIDNALYKINQKTKEGTNVPDLAKRLDKINIENQKIHRIAKIITSANFDLLSETIETDLVEYIKQYLEVGYDKKVVDIETVVLNNKIKFVTEFQPIEISVIFDNFISNSSKAGADVMNVSFEKQGRNLRILVGDDGEGISKSNQKFLFIRGFSSSKRGSGLGLHHIKSLVADIGGKIKFIGNNVPDMGKGACFEVVIY